MKPFIKCIFRPISITMRYNQNTRAKETKYYDDTNNNDDHNDNVVRSIPLDRLEEQQQQQDDINNIDDGDLENDVDNNSEYTNRRSYRAFSKKHRIYIFYEFLMKVYYDYLYYYDSSCLNQDDSNHPDGACDKMNDCGDVVATTNDDDTIIVLDVAGGKGDLSWLLTHVNYTTNDSNSTTGNGSCNNNHNSHTNDPKQQVQKQRRRRKRIRSIVMDPRLLGTNNHIVRSVQYLVDHPNECMIRSQKHQHTYQPIASFLQQNQFYFQQQIRNDSNSSSCSTSSSTCKSSELDLETLLHKPEYIKLPLNHELVTVLHSILSLFPSKQVCYQQLLQFSKKQQQAQEVVPNNDHSNQTMNYSNNNSNNDNSNNDTTPNERKDNVQEDYTINKTKSRNNNDFHNHDDTNHNQNTNNNSTVLDAATSIWFSFWDRTCNNNSTNSSTTISKKKKKKNRKKDRNDGYDVNQENLYTKKQNNDNTTNSDLYWISDPWDVLFVLLRVQLIVGFHPDQATDSIIDLASVLGTAVGSSSTNNTTSIPYAIVPCCVYPKEFPNRLYYQMILQEDKEEEEGETYELLAVQSNEKPFDMNNNTNNQLVVKVGTKNHDIVYYCHPVVVTSTTATTIPDNWNETYQRNVWMDCLTIVPPPYVNNTNNDVTTNNNNNNNKQYLLQTTTTTDSNRIVQLQYHHVKRYNELVFYLKQKNPNMLSYQLPFEGTVTAKSIVLYTTVAETITKT